MTMRVPFEGQRHSLLVFIPTYNERWNVELLLQRIMLLGLDLDILFMDDNSPDGTGQLLDLLAEKNQRVFVIHRSGKLGIGSAHQQGIRWAYGHGYKMLVTMDADLMHPPEMIADLCRNSESSAVVVGSRFLRKDSMEGLGLFRLVLARIGHALTSTVLHLPYDATGAFRLYRLDRVPRQVFDHVHSSGYSFFYESLFILDLNKFRIKEVPVKVGMRAYGYSKMRMADVWQSLILIGEIFFRKAFDRKKYIIIEPFSLPIDQQDLQGGAEWEAYWGRRKSVAGFLYGAAASFYRTFIIKSALDYFIHKYFQKDAHVLHAGCGGGQVDVDVSKYLNITAMDHSVNALNLYKRHNDGRGQLLYGDIFHIPLPDRSMDGVYNLGVMEHYGDEDIARILFEFKRVLKPGAFAVLFWPPQYGLSVVFLKAVHFFLKKFFKQNEKMHPDEVCLIRSREHVEKIVRQAGFDMVQYYFGLKDMLTYCVVVIRPVLP